MYHDVLGDLLSVGLRNFYRQGVHQSVIQLCLGASISRPLVLIYLPNWSELMLTLLIDVSTNTNFI